MKHAVTGLVALSLIACSKERQPRVGPTTITAATDEMPAQVSVDEVRHVLLEKRPGSADTINALLIRSENGIVTLTGKVDDEETRWDLVNRVRAMPNVRGVRDQLSAPSKAPSAAPGK
jgi:osmotically-inducible protein OsmY